MTVAASNPILEVIKAVPLTFYSKEIYVRAVRAWKGVGGGFILMVTLLAVAFAFASARQIPEVLAEMQNIVGQMPAMTVKDHRITIDAPAPYVVKLFDTKSDTMANNLVIDPTFTSTDTTVISDYMKKQNAFFLVTGDKLISRNQQGVQVDDLSKLPNDQHFSHDDWVKLGKTAADWAYPVLGVIDTIGIILANCILALLGAVVALILGLVASIKLDFAAAMRLAATAAVPACIVTTPLQLAFGIKLLIWLGYTIFGLIAIKRAEKTAHPPAL